jgi:hypothetical protein
MKITDLNVAGHSGRMRASATVSWEDCHRPAQEIFFETTSDFASGLAPDPNAYLIAGSLPALFFGERRIKIDGAVCPQLLENFEVAMNWIAHWFHGSKHMPMSIEVKKEKLDQPLRRRERSGFVLSGDIDSLATLRHNQLEYPKSHPGRIRDGLIIFGLEEFNSESFPDIPDNLKAIAADTGIELVPVCTNIRTLGPPKESDLWTYFWLTHYLGAAFGAVAHALSKRFSHFTINASHDIPNLVPYGSHPLVDPYYSSHRLRINHAGCHLSPYQKIQLIADWANSLENLSVCENLKNRPSSILNCGVCEKCVRTMLALTGCGVLEKATAFLDKDVTVTCIAESVTINSDTLPIYAELLDPLSSVGRPDLVSAIYRKIEAHREKNKPHTLKSRVAKMFRGLRKKKKRLTTSLKQPPMDLIKTHVNGT